MAANSQFPEYETVLITFVIVKIYLIENKTQMLQNVVHHWKYELHLFTFKHLQHVLYIFRQDGNYMVFAIYQNIFNLCPYQ